MINNLDVEKYLRKQLISEVKPTVKKSENWK